MKVKIKGGQKTDEGVKTSKNYKGPNVQEIANLHIKSAYKKS